MAKNLLNCEWLELRCVLKTVCLNSNPLQWQCVNSQIHAGYGPEGWSKRFSKQMFPHGGNITNSQYKNKLWIL